jgi:hypothetical protein
MLVKRFYVSRISHIRMFKTNVTINPFKKKKKQIYLTILKCVRAVFLNLGGGGGAGSGK